MNSEDVQTRMLLNSKLRSPSQHSESSTMDSFQDGGPMNNSEQSEYQQNMDGSYMNSDVNSYGPSPGDGGMGPENYCRMPEGMHPGQMSHFNSYNRGNYNMGDNTLPGSTDFSNHSTGYQGQYTHPGGRAGYPAGGRSGMGVPGPGGGMIPGGCSSGQQRLISGHSMNQQAGPTPTLNQLLQTPNSGPRYQQNNYGDYGGMPTKGSGEMTGSNGPYNAPPAWGPNQRGMGGYSQMSAAPYRGQMPSHYGQQNQGGYQNQGLPTQSSQSQPMMGQQVPPQQPPQPPGLPPGSSPPPHLNSQSVLSPHQRPTPQQSPHQSQQQRPTPQPSPHQQRPAPQPSPGQQHQAQPSPGQLTRSSQPASQSQPSPNQQPLASQATGPNQSSPQQQMMSHSQHNHQSSPQESGSWSHGKNSAEDSEFGGQEQMPNLSEDVNSDNSGSQNSASHPGISVLRPTPSPGSVGSRSNTPASLTGNQVGSPMPPRPPSQQLDGQQQNSRMSQSPMSSTGYNQQMMPPPMGPNQMNYVPGNNKMGMGGMPGSQMGPYPPYNSQYPQSGNNYPGRQPSGPGMPNYPQQQNTYSGPNPMYNNNMSMNRTGYNTYPGQGGGGIVGMNNQYGNYNHMNSGGMQSCGPGGQQMMGGPQGPPVTGPPGGVGNMGGSGPNSIGGGRNMDGPGVVNSGTNSPSSHSVGGKSAPVVKGAQAAAQEVLYAAAKSAGRSQSVQMRPIMSPGPGQRNLYGAQPGSQPMSPLSQMGQMSQQMDHIGYNSTTNNMPNSRNQQTPPPPRSVSPVPNSQGLPASHSTMASGMSNSRLPPASVPNSMSSMMGVNSSGCETTSKSMNNISSSHSSSSISKSNSALPPANIGSMQDGKAEDAYGSSNNNNSSSLSVNSSSPNVPESNSNSSNLQNSSDSSKQQLLNIPNSNENSNSSSTIDNVSSEQPGDTKDNKGPVMNNAATGSGRNSSSGHQKTTGQSVVTNSTTPTSTMAGGDMKSGRSMDHHPNINANSREEKLAAAAAYMGAVDLSTTVTQSITSPVTSISTEAEAGNSNDSSQLENIPAPPVPNCIPPMAPMPTIDEPPEKKKKEGVLSHPTTPSSFVAPSPGGVSISSSVHEDLDTNLSSPGWSGSNSAAVSEFSTTWLLSPQSHLVQYIFYIVCTLPLIIANAVGLVLILLWFWFTVDRWYLGYRVKGHWLKSPIFISEKSRITFASYALYYFYIAIQLK